MKTVHAFFYLILACSAHTLISCPTGINCNDDQETVIIIDEDDMRIGTDLILTP